MIKNYIDELTGRGTTGEYIKSRLRDTNVLHYTQLAQYDSIDDIFGKDGTCVLLYPNEHSEIGHWCAIIKNGKLLSYFDSYGYKPDEKLIDSIPPYLSLLILRSGYECEYSPQRYQKKQDAATCGHHVILRLLLSDNLEIYEKFMERIKNDDDVVTLISKFMV